MAPTIAQVLCSDFSFYYITCPCLVLSAEQITWPHNIKQHLVFEHFLLLDLLFLESGSTRSTLILRVIFYRNTGVLVYSTGRPTDS